MNTTPSAATPALASSDVEARIHAERERLLAEQNLEHTLTGQRLAPLEAGDDEALDRIEAQLNSTRDRQFRIQERIELLEKRRTEVQTTEREWELDELASRATRAREMGEQLIRVDYAKQANALAETLAKLEAINALIDQANMALRSGGRDVVHQPNMIRCQPRREWQETVIRRVGLSEALHPHHGKARRSGNTDVAYLDSGEGQVPAFADVEVVEHKIVDAIREPELTEAVMLPGIGPAPEGHNVRPLWDKNVRARIRLDKPNFAAEIEAALDSSLLGKAAKAVGRVFARKNGGTP